jgi:hypothetical protein
MNALAQKLLETAAMLIEEARKLAAPEVDTRTFFTGTGAPGAGWLTMLEIYARDDAARGKTPFDPSLRAGIMGTAGGSPMPKSWETHKRILDAAERGELNGGVPWPAIDGRPFKRWDWLDNTTEEKHAALVDLWHSPRGIAWRAHPDNLPVLPKGEPEL